MIEFPTAVKIYLFVIAFILGSCIGSFVNCAADRRAAHESILRGRSHCPACGHGLSILDLFPIFSWLFLRGKCRYCGSKIPVRCLITELIGGAAYLFILLRFGFGFVSLELLLLTPALLAIALIDLDTMEIPNGLLIYMVVVFGGFVASYEEPLRRLVEGAIGLAAFGGGVLIIALIMDKVLKRESLGGGDVKLFGAAGLFLGPWKGLFMVILACIIGLIFSLIYKKKQDGQFPFGPAICLATFVSLLVGQYVIDIYLSLFI